MIKRSFFHRCFFFRPRISDHNYLSLHKCKICNTETHQKTKIQSQLLTEATLNMRIIHDPTSCCVWATYCVIFSQTFVPLRKHSIYLHCREHSVKSVRIRSYSGPYFPAFILNTDQNNFEYGTFSRSVNDNNITWLSWNILLLVNLLQKWGEVVHWL